MIDLPTIVRFLMQSGLAVAGAASLWSVFLHYRRRKTSEENKAKNLEKLAGFLTTFFFLGFTIFILSWIVLKDVFYVIGAWAHEGIVVKAAIDYVQDGLQAIALPVYLLVFLVAVLVYISRYRKDLFNRYGIFLFGASFLLVSLIDFFILYVGSFSKLQFFYFLHHWHSIFTLGTVITVDYLYFKTIRNVNLKGTIYPLFPFLSMAIWIGLGLDFLSNLLIFEQAFVVNSQFLFVQTVVAIIILNGAMLSDRINKRLIATVRPNNPQPLSRRENLFFGLSGSVSITSWLTITFVDLFAFDLKYWQFFAYYLFIMAIAFLANLFMERLFVKRVGNLA